MVALLMVLTAATPGLRAADVIDRVLAVVSGTIITLSEARAAILLGFVNTTGAADPIDAALKALIDRELVLDELDRSVVPEPDPALVTRRVERVRERFPEAERFQQALAASGTDESGLRALARDDVRVKQYIDRRFEAVLPPSDAEVQNYYQANAGQFTRDGQVLPLEEVRGEILARFVDSRRRDAIEAWMARLRRRADVVQLYLPQKKEPGGGRPDQVGPPTAHRIS